MDIKQIQGFLKMVPVVTVCRGTGLSAPTVRTVRDKGTGNDSVLYAISRYMDEFRSKLETKKGDGK